MGPDEMVRWMMERLMKSTADNFELALACYDAKGREEALAQAKRLIESEDLATRALGERLQAEILSAPISLPDQLVQGGSEGQGDSLLPLSLPSSPHSPVEVSSTDREPERVPALTEEAKVQVAQPSNSASIESSPKKRRGRPRKHPLPPN